MPHTAPKDASAMLRAERRAGTISAGRCGDLKSCHRAWVGATKAAEDSRGRPPTRGSESSRSREDGKGCPAQRAAPAKDTMRSPPGSLATKPPPTPMAKLQDDIQEIDILLEASKRARESVADRSRGLYEEHLATQRKFDQDM